MAAPPPAEAPFEAFAQCGERLLLIGGNAMIAYGSERLTQDCDCAVLIQNERMVAGVLAPLGYVFEVNRGAFSRYVHLGQERPVVDVMLLDESTFSKLLIESEEQEVGGTKLRVPKPLHLVALKLHALKQNPARLGKDWEDIQFLLGKFPWNRDELSRLAQHYASAETIELLQTNSFL